MHARAIFSNPGGQTRGKEVSHLGDRVAVSPLRPNLPPWHRLFDRGDSGATGGILLGICSASPVR